MSTFEFPRFFSVDSPKAVKSIEYGWLNAINYMAPHDSAGHGSLCSHASAGCIALCLGEHSGQAAMVSRDTGTNEVRESRKRKVRSFFRNRAAFLQEAARHIARLVSTARKAGLKLAVRMNGATDLAWERYGIAVDATLARSLSRSSGLSIAPGIYQNLMTLFPTIQFVDYTKNPIRFDRPLPANLSLTFSRSESNDDTCRAMLARGVNVAVVFRGGLPREWFGRPVVDGDQHDLRHLDPRDAQGYVVGLSPKGNKARRDTSGFVVDLPAAMALAA